MRAKKLGTYTQGEIPEPITYTYKTRAGVAIDLSGCTAVAELSHAGTTVELSATVAANQTTNKGEVTFSFADGDLDDLGAYELTLWVGDGGTLRLASRLYRLTVARAAGSVIASV